MFFSDYSFQFVVDTLLPKSTYERCLFSAFGNFRLLNYTNLSLSWDDAMRDEVFMPIGEEAVIAVRGSTLIPSHFVTNGHIIFENLVRAHYAIISVIASDSSFLDFYFSRWLEYKKNNSLVPTINLHLKDSYRIRIPQAPNSLQSKLKLRRDKMDGKIVSIENLYGVFSDKREFTFATEKEKYGGRYGLYSAFNENLVALENFGAPKRYKEFVENSCLARKIALVSTKIIPSQLLSEDTIEKDTLLNVQQKIRALISQYPELLDAYFPTTKKPTTDILTAISNWKPGVCRENKSSKEKQYHI